MIFLGVYHMQKEYDFSNAVKNPYIQKDVYKYSITITWDEQENSYIANVPDLPGCMADGETLEEVIKRIQESIRIWIEVNAERGLEIPFPSTFFFPK